MTPVFQYNWEVDVAGTDSARLAGLPLRPDFNFYFWTETWCDAMGPYDSKEEAEAGCEKYAREVLG